MPRTLTRTEFENGLAAGWAFGVPVAFKAALDISSTSKVLSGRGGLAMELARRGIAVPTAALRGDAKALSEMFAAVRADGLAVVDYRVEAKDGKKRVVVEIETEGNPPVYSFSVGDVFYEPRKARLMVWVDALTLLRRCVKITKVDSKFITVSIWNYSDGVASPPHILTCTSAAFVHLLRTGIVNSPELAAPQADAVSSTNAMKSVS